MTTAPAAQSGREATRAAALAAVRTLLAFSGDDPDRAELRRTPERVVAAYGELFAGYAQDPVALLRRSRLRDPLGGRVVSLRRLRFTSMCEHHLLPFTGEVHLGFVSQDFYVGLGAVAEALAALSRRLQLQERLTDELAAALSDALCPRALLVAIEAEHQCLGARGPRQQARFVTCRTFGQADGELGQTLRHAVLTGLSEPVTRPAADRPHLDLVAC